MGEVSIRRAVKADLGGVVSLLDQLDELHRRALPWLLREVKGPQPNDFLDPYVSRPDHVMFLAVASDGGIAGALYAFLREPVRAPVVIPTVVAEIDTLVVETRFRRQNIGTRLVRAGLEWASLSGATRTELGVYEFNEPARAFWASIGFETLSRRLVRHSKPSP